MIFLSRTAMIAASLLLLATLLCVACSDGEETEPEPDVDIIIGYFGDMTGPSSSALELVTMALEDAIDRYNEQGLIPGVNLKLVSYDSVFDPARTIPGYEWLRNKGADLILTAIPATPAILGPRAATDGVVVFALTATIEEITPPANVFNMGTIPQYEAYTLLKWIAENDWDYQAKGPAKIGGAAWNEPYSNAFLRGLEEYAVAHPDQFDWVSGHTTNFSFVWGPEVEALKDCDYVSLPTPPTSFVKEYRSAGYDAKFINSIPNSAFMGLVDQADLWDEMDGSLFLYAGMWWNQTGEEIDWVRELLYENHSDDAEEIIRKGSGYIGIGSLTKVLEIIGNAAQEVGPENFNSDALYNAAESYIDYKEGLEIASFSEDKRYAVNYYTMYEISASERDLVLIDPEWYRQSIEP